MSKCYLFISIFFILSTMSYAQTDTSDVEVGNNVINYTITFESNGGNPIESQNVKFRRYVEKPAKPIKNDYTFYGWYAEKSLLNLWRFSLDRVERNINLYAKWIHNSLVDIQKSELIFIDGGTYTQEPTKGSRDAFEHNVTSFEIGKYEITYELWYVVFQWAISNGYQFANAGREGNSGEIGAAPTTDNYKSASYTILPFGFRQIEQKEEITTTERLPVTSINWYDAIVWCNAYSEMSGFSPCYVYASAIIKSSKNDNKTACDESVCKWFSNGYRLPTEGEWQYAASNKGETSSNYASGATAETSDTEATGKVAWYDSNSSYRTRAVGTTSNSNTLGIWDMSGNVYEWCWDWYDDYPSMTQTNYYGPISGSGFSASRILRGGSWDNFGFNLPAGHRYYSSPNNLNPSTGFRIVRRQ